jgi:hypothetical protein
MGIMNDIYTEIIDELNEGLTPLEVSRKLNIPVEMVLQVLEQEPV